MNQIKLFTKTTLKYWITTVVILLVLILFFQYNRKQGHITSSTEIDTLDVLPEKELYAFGIQLDTFKVIKGKIRSNEFLSDILIKHNVSYNKIDLVAKASVDVFDVKKMMTGKNYQLICNKDAESTCRYFVYERNPAEFYIYKLFDSVAVYKFQKEITIVRQKTSGIITGSLYQTMVDNNTSPILALALSDVYAWQIDFFRIQKGDQYKVVYEERFVDDKSLGIGRIRAAYFKHYNEEFYAIYFVQDSIGDYFDNKGNGLRKAFLKAPLEYSRITSRFSANRFHPILKKYKAHLGTDYAAPTGTPIRTVGDGVIVEAGYKGGNGNYVKVKHNSTYTTQYLHMSKIANGIKPGVFVRQGDLIGYVGSTGLATGPHVCFRFWKNGVQVNPFSIKLPPSEPVKPEFMAEYNIARENALILLNSIDFKKAK